MINLNNYSTNLYQNAARIASRLNPRNIMITAVASATILLSACGGNPSYDQVRYIINELRPISTGSYDSKDQKELVDEYGEKYGNISKVGIYRVLIGDDEVLGFYHLHESRSFKERKERAEICSFEYGKKVGSKSSFFSSVPDELRWEVRTEVSYLDKDCDGTLDGIAFGESDEPTPLDELSGEERKEASKKFNEGLELLIDNY